MPNSRFRVLVRVVELQGDRVKLVAPAWQAEQSFDVPRGDLPGTPVVDKRYHCRLNLAAKTVTELAPFTEWEDF
jgi:hypothetical protein